MLPNLRHPLRAILLVALLSGCGRSRTVAVDLSALDPAFGRENLRTIVLGVERRGEIDVVVIDAKDRRGLDAVPTISGFDGSFEVAYTAALYQETPEELGITTVGRLPVALPGDEGGAIPETGEVFVRSVSRDDGDWSKGDLREAVRNFRSTALPANSGPCSSLDAEAFTLDSVEQASAATELADGSALIGLSRSQFRFNEMPPPQSALYRVTRDGASRVIVPNFDTTVGAVRINALTEAPDGTIYISTGSWTGGAGRVWQGTLQNGFEMTPTPPGSAWIRWMITDADGRLYAETDYSAVWRFDPSTRQWDVVNAPPEPLGSCLRLAFGDASVTDYQHYCGGLWWADDGRLIAKDSDGDRLRLIDVTGASAPVVVDIPGNGFKLGVAPTEIGFIVTSGGNANTDFYVLRDDRLEDFLLGVSTQAVYSLGATPRGFLFSGAFGYVTQYSADAEPELCPSHDALARSLRPLRFTRLGDGSMVLSGWTGRAGGNFVVVVSAR